MSVRLETAILTALLAFIALAWLHRLIFQSW